MALSYIVTILSVLIFPILFGYIAYRFDSRAVAKGYEAFERCKVLALCSAGGLVLSLGLLYGSTLFQIASRSNLLVTVSQLLTYSLVALAVVSLVVLLVDFAIMAYLGLKHS